MMTVGVVQLSGMLTGQIPAGPSPLTAIRFQIVVVFMMAEPLRSDHYCSSLAAAGYLTPAPAAEVPALRRRRSRSAYYEWDGTLDDQGDGLNVEPAPWRAVRSAARDALARAGSKGACRSYPQHEAVCVKRIAPRPLLDRVLTVW
jgi:hypothetical protein